MADTARQPEALQEEQETLVLDVNVEAPDAVDAGSTFAAHIRMTANQITDLRGERFDVLDGGEVVVSGVALAELDPDGVHTSESFELTAPTSLGVHTWTIAFDPEDPDQAPYESVHIPFDVHVKAHDLRVQTWGAPTAVPAGQSFQVNVGVACSSGCPLPGQPFDVLDEDDTILASSSLGPETWKSTNALYFATVELTAPIDEGHVEWRVKTRDTSLEFPHEHGVAKFGLNATPSPEHTVRVTAIDKDKGEPIEGMHVWLHPFRAVTNENGVAEVAVPEGEYRLYVSGLRYFPHDARVEIAGDLDTTVELTWEVRPEKIR